KQHFTLTKILKKQEQEANGSKRKRRQKLKKSRNQPQNAEKRDDDFQVNLNDNRFKAVYKSHEYNIDPTHSHYKPTKGMQHMIGEKLKRRKEQAEGGAANGDADGDEQVAPKRSKQQLEQNALVKSLKRKIQMQQQGQKL
ncbi:GD16551, partial [Drosophila simulans]